LLHPVPRLVISITYHSTHFRDVSFQAINCTGTDNQITMKRRENTYNTKSDLKTNKLT